MSEFYGFASASPWLVFGLALVVYWLASLLFKAWNRFLRSRNIEHHGWPPEHLDADGDFRPERDTQ